MLKGDVQDYFMGRWQTKYEHRHFYRWQKKNRHKSSLTYARFSHSLPSHSFTTKLDISLQKNFPSIEFDNKRGGSLIIEEETATFYNLFLQELHFSIF